MIRIKRVYDEFSDDDGTRVLVDRLWPRGVSKAKANVSLWLKEVAPTTELREWFNHQPERFEEFSKLYTKELSQNPAVDTLKGLTKGSANLTLVYSAKNTDMNQAVVLQKFLASL